MAKKYPEGYYVYLHIRNTDGKVFYVGKGKGNRAWVLRDSERKNKHWSNIKHKHGIEVEIYKDGMTEVCALTLERILIYFYRNSGFQLSNMTIGGEGVSGYVNPEWRSLYSSLGERFDRMGDAINYLKSEGRLGACASGINQCCNGRSKSYMGRAWSYCEFPPHPENTGHNATISGARAHFSKEVYSSLGEKFHSIVEAVIFLKSIGFTKAGSANISRSCKSSGLFKAYDRGWSFSGFPEHIHENRLQRVSAANKFRMSRQVMMDGELKFKSQVDAALYMRDSGHLKAVAARIGSVCNGNSKTAYGHTWAYADDTTTKHV